MPSDARRVSDGSRGVGILKDWVVQSAQKLDLIADEAHPIGFWRRVIKETHGIDLPARP